MIEVNHLTKYYGSKAALDDVSFSIPDKQVVGLLGLNGAGKSTTMNILTGCISATGGSVAIGGHDIAADSRAAKRITGYLPEQPAFYPEMRVGEYLDFVCDLKGVPGRKRERGEHVAEICRQVGLADMGRRMIRNLSKGYRQRVGFAQALLGDPRAIILDEPTVGLDPSQIIEIRELIRRCGAESAVIVSSHILAEIQAVCDRVLVLREGRLIADDTPERLVSRMGGSHRLRARIKGEPKKVFEALRRLESVRSVRQLDRAQAEPGAWDYAVEGREGGDIREDVFQALAAADLPLLSTRGAEQSLEDAFLHLTGKANRDAGEDEDG